MKAFSRDELDGRIQRIRDIMAGRRLDGCVITNPENIFYLTGLHHQGFFAFTAVILPLEGQPALVIRAMESAIVADLLDGVDFIPYSDGVELRPGEDGLEVLAQTDGAPGRDAAVDATCAALDSLKLSRGRVAFERSSAALPYRIVDGFMSRMPNVTWLDADGIVADCRMIQSPVELAYTRKAAEISDAMVLAGIAAAGPGVRKRDIVSSIYQVMLQRGGTYPAFPPFVRSNSTMTHEHGTWDHHDLERRDLLFLELAGCEWRYHAPLGRLIHIGGLDPKSERIHAVALEAHYAAAETLKPGTLARDVYQAWQGTVDRAGLSHYRRHHCGYMVGIAFPPSWSGSGVPRGLRPSATLEIQQGMVFHLMSWLMRTGQGDAFLSDTVTITAKGCEFLTSAPRELTVR